MDQEGEFSKVFVDISSVCLTGFGMISIHAEQLQISFSPWKQNESIWNYRF